MWAGSRIKFAHPIELGAELERCSEVTDIQIKQGASGALVFVTLRHQIITGGEVAIVEEQDLVYRDPSGASGAKESPPDGPERVDWRESIAADPVLLFRYSALTYNAHRIHYDRDYARNVEGYPALVVHGPLIATLLMNAYLRHNRGAAVVRFAFKARRPLFDDAPFELAGLQEGAVTLLWAIDGGGRIAMTAAVEAKAC